MPDTPSEPPGFSLDAILAAPTPRRYGKVVVSPHLYDALTASVSTPEERAKLDDAVAVYQR